MYVHPSKTSSSSVGSVGEAALPDPLSMSVLDPPGGAAVGDAVAGAGVDGAGVVGTGAADVRAVVGDDGAVGDVGAAEVGDGVGPGV